MRLLSEFLERRRSPLTVDVSKDDVRDFITEQGTPRTITDSLGRKHRGGSPSTAPVRFKALQQYFRHCVEEEELELSPMTGMRAPKVNEYPVPNVSDDTLSEMLKARSGKSLEDGRDAAILRVFLDTGCRLSEVTNLRVSDIDNQTIRVLGKGSCVRVVTFGAKMAQALERYLRVLERERPERLMDPDGWLWIGRQGRMSTSGLSRPPMAGRGGQRGRPDVPCRVAVPIHAGPLCQICAG